MFFDKLFKTSSVIFKVCYVGNRQKDTLGLVVISEDQSGVQVKYFVSQAAKFMFHLEIIIFRIFRVNVFQQLS